MGVEFCTTRAYQWGMPAYSEMIDRLLLQPGLLQKLIPTEPLDRAWVRRVVAADAQEITGGATLAQPPMLPLLRGGLLYALDALDLAHVPFQEESSDLGSYWHGMLHRREGDFDNARYWFRRAGALPFFARLHSVAAESSALMARQANWDPYAFTGECEQLRHGSEETEKLPELQRAEFEAVFDYSWRQGIDPGARLS